MNHTLMHCGAGAVTRAGLDALPAPEPRGASHHPIAHHAFVELIEDRVKRQNLDVLETRYYLNRGGDQLFGLYRLEPTRSTHQPVIGFRNSHDMSFSAGLAMGTRVFVCDNTVFAGEIVLKRKHTARILNDLPELIDQGLVKLRQLGQTQEERITAYQQTQLTEADAARLLIECHAAKAVNANKILEAWNHYLEDPLGYDQERAPTYWRLYNTVTWTWKRSPAQLMGPIHHKSAALHTILDEDLAHAA